MDLEYFMHINHAAMKAFQDYVEMRERGYGGLN